MATKEPMRLQRYLAMCGVDSRRHCETLITDGRVTVDGRVATLGERVLGTETICLDAQPVVLPGEKRYFAYYKPSKVMSTLSDPEGRPTIAPDLAALGGRLFSVGRLDFLTEGLLLLTDDGDWAQRAAHPKHEIEKEYIVLVVGEVSEARLQQLRDGVILEERSTFPAKVDKLGEDGNKTRLRITIHEGRNRQVRRMVEQVGLEAVWLCRTREGPILLGDLKPGESRALTPREITLLGGQPVGRED